MKPTLLLTLLLSTLGTPVSSFAAPAAVPRPNVVFIIADDMGYPDYGFMGSKDIDTLHLDRLAAQSLVFPSGHVPTSLCCPSLATIITGLYPHQHRITANDPPLARDRAKSAKNLRGSSAELTERWNGALDGLATLPRVLAQQGYASFQTGKWWHGDFSRGGFTHGMSKGTRHGDDGLKIGREGLQPVHDFIRTARGEGKPFFLWYAPLLPHTPHTPPEALLKNTRPAPRLRISPATAPCVSGSTRPAATSWRISTARDWRKTPSSSTSPTTAGRRTQMPAASHRRTRPRPTTSVIARKHVFGECFTVRSQTLDDPAANVLWRWTTEDRWRLIVPRTHGATGLLAAIPRDNYLKPDLVQTLTAAQPLLFDIRADPCEETNLAEQHPAVVTGLLRQLDAFWKPQPIVDKP